MGELRNTTDAELRGRWEDAVDGDRVRLIDELAVENRTTRACVREALAAIGCELPPAPQPVRALHRVGPKPRLDEARARALYDQGLSDYKIGKALGMSTSSILNWRQRNGLLSHTQLLEGAPAEPAPAAAPDALAPAEDAPLTLGGLRRLLAMCLPEELNDAELYLDGVPLLGLDRIVTSWAGAGPRVDVVTRRGGCCG